MSDIIISLLEESDAQELFTFELKNRVFFEKVGFPRGDSYYELNNFNTIIKESIEEQEKGLVYMYLIKNQTGMILGRINLLSIVRESFNKAELGYRIGEEHQGNGYATIAVKLILDKAVNNHKLHRIEAGTSPNKIGSQIVLIKNGFQFVGRYNKYIYKNGKWCDSIYFERILD
ncbi:GNAT family N-acetyltransferase [Clostridium beijerinckii]|uniref:Ribosomal-protein-alanine N-acetyltransferase n=1 Tax=Clostridium beijerinckii TaxID=1520 RepID=A0AAE5H2A2_CLOBE|nr:GNAT family protein [Clostridium beijerinckii]NSB13441.1 ribosomal-protein-alanine N-acetyltransferase [Clostridium beijerinckii]OOM28359.1 ribosomal-protein-S5-alanine N-acetyltransferase [Clostridium beijerinckii]